MLLEGFSFNDLEHVFIVIATYSPLWGRFSYDFNT